MISNKIFVWIHKNINLISLLKASRSSGSNSPHLSKSRRANSTCEGLVADTTTPEIPQASSVQTDGSEADANDTEEREPDGGVQMSEIIPENHS